MSSDARCQSTQKPDRTDQQQPAAHEVAGPLTVPTDQLPDFLGNLAYQALITEATLTPKPGLVDMRNNGAHKDMTLATFIASANALQPLFAEFVRLGISSHSKASNESFARLRLHGIRCEKTMNATTAGINTHKGAIFAFGLLLGAAGRCIGRDETPGPAKLCEEVKFLAQGLVEVELDSRSETASTAGEYIYQRYGLSGARGEAQSGFETVLKHSLPVYLKLRQNKTDYEAALLAALLELFAYNRDTNLVARGGIEGMFFVRHQARALKEKGGIFAPDFEQCWCALDDTLIERNLSPGGSADLVAVTWFLGELDKLAPNDHGHST
ncbi:triphosphoribosyl-dephospho-CoA synthase CitG [uncultured Cohaesibacter sp.]|uniref:triphosphoribosyl-dephospho-CoA synthase CitG n=1 Tax=uncultured Cohaesibacter sp. TaxID=1002546 RepID=UPI0029304D55|nr:triphosphoribosyl-dephospho-CoA synthase CitG [uncultured Cohaesibacter sp.]